MKKAAETPENDGNIIRNNLEILKEANLGSIQNEKLKKILSNVVKEEKLNYKQKFGTYDSYDSFQSKPEFSYEE